MPNVNWRQINGEERLTVTQTIFVIFGWRGRVVRLDTALKRWDAKRNEM